MVILLCVECNEEIAAADYELRPEILNKAAQHATTCARATFNVAGTTSKGWENASEIRIALSDVRLTRTVE